MDDSLALTQGGKDTISIIEYMMGSFGQTSNKHAANLRVRMKATFKVTERRATGKPWLHGTTTDILAKELINEVNDLGVTYMKQGKDKKWYPATEEDILTTMKTMINRIKRAMEHSSKLNDWDFLGNLGLLDEYDSSAIFPPDDGATNEKYVPKRSTSPPLLDCEPQPLDFGDMPTVQQQYLQRIHQLETELRNAQAQLEP